MKNLLENQTEKSKMASFWNTFSGPPGLSGIIFIALFFLVLFGQQLGNIFSVLIDSDSCWLIKTGTWILQHHVIPTNNVFGGSDPNLAKIPIVCYQWLFEVILGFFFQSLGLQGVVFFVAACFGLTYLLLTFWLYEKGNKGVPDVLFSLLLSLFALNSFAMARPALITILFTAFLFRCCNQDLQSKKIWWILPLLFLFWANLHLGFIAGLAFLGLFLFEKAWREKSRSPILLWLICAFATLLNPYGFGLFIYFAQLANSPFMNQHIMDLCSPAFNTKPVMLAYFMLSLFSALFAFQDSRIRWAEKVIFLISFGLALYSIRHLCFLGLATLPFTSIAIENFRKKKMWHRYFQSFRFDTFLLKNEKPWLWITGALLIGVFIVQHNQNLSTFPKEAKLSGVIQYLKKEQVPTPMLSNEFWGSYLIYYTEQRSYLDSRMDMYGDERTKDFFVLLNLQPGWQEAFAKYHFKTLLLAADSFSAEHLIDNCNAKVLYLDENAVLVDVQHLSTNCLHPNPILQSR